VFSGTGHVVRTKERWNNPRINTYRLAAIFFAFIVFGMNDASYGALIPYVRLPTPSPPTFPHHPLTLPPQIEADYHTSYLVTSLVFLSPFAGYTLSAFLSDRLHRLAGRRGIALIAPSCKLLAYIVIAIHPPYPVVVVILAAVGIGNGLLDAAWNAWIGTMDHPNQLLGLLHACYGLGATISPLIGTSMVTKGNLGWWTFYYIMIGLAACELVVGTWAFWTETGMKYRDTNRADGEEKGMTRRALRNKVTWICSAFFLAYVGTEGTPTLKPLTPSHLHP
jgi:fucose permease